MKKLILVALVLGAAYFGGVQKGLIPQGNDGGVRSVDEGAQTIAAAFEQRQRDVQVQGSGRVRKVLSDDKEGSRHQRFIVELPSGQTVLVAHNIDLASRVDALRPGDRIEFYGEYEWNAQGGVIHWTHHDPRGSHVAGWIKHNGRTYQ